MKHSKKAYTLTVIYDSSTGEIEYAEESIEKLEKRDNAKIPDLDDEDIRRSLIESGVVGES